MSKQLENQLWLLRARLDRPLETPADFEDYPWTPPWDKCYGLVIEAATEERARQIANAVPLALKYEDGPSTAPDAFLRAIEDGQPLDDEQFEGPRDEVAAPGNEKKNVWLDSKYTTCIPLVCTGQERRVIWDVLRG